jgi:hypothetical protein
MTQCWRGRRGILLRKVSREGEMSCMYLPDLSISTTKHQYSLVSYVCSLAQITNHGIRPSLCDLWRCNWNC